MESEQGESSGWLALILAVPFASMIAGAIWKGELSLVQGAGLILLGGLSIVCCAAFLVNLKSEGAPQVTTHWGGLSGNRGGWRISRSIVALIATLVFGGLFGAELRQVAPAAPKAAPSDAAAPKTDGQTPAITPKVEEGEKGAAALPTSEGVAPATLGAPSTELSNQKPDVPE